MNTRTPIAWTKRIAGLLCLVLMASSLGGCVIVPFRPYHVWPRYYY